MTPFRKTRGQRSSFRPTVEGLEDRTVPAGNVTATISGGNLMIVGDAADNAIKIQGNTRGTIDITSLDSNTVINSQPGMVTLVGFSGSVFITMNDGHDAVQVDHMTIFGNITADMGNGDDMLVLTTSTVKGIINVAEGEGNDRFSAGDTTFAGTAFINVGNGDNQINLLGVQFLKDSYFAAGAGTTSMGKLNVKFKQAPGTQNIGQQINAALPRAVDDSTSVANGGTVKVAVTTNDLAVQGTINTASVLITKAPTNGTAVVNGDGSISYTHNGSATTTDFIGYTVANSFGAVSNQALIGINITGSSTVNAPTVAVTSTATSPTKTSPIPFTATFNQSVTGFSQSGLAVTNGTVSGFTAVSGSVYTFNVTPTGQGAVSVTVSANAAQNSSNQGNTASTAFSVTFDTTPPAIVINSLTTNDTTPTLTGTIDDATATLSITVGGQTIAAVISGTTWSATVPTALAAGTFAVSASATDKAGNVGTANNATGLIIDLTPPTVSITSTTASPTTGAFPITVLFSKAVTGFVAGDIAVTNGTLGNFAANADGKTYTATVTPTAAGTVFVNVAANVATDAAGNGNSAAAAFSIIFDSNGAPTAVVTTTAGNQTNTSPIPFTATFSTAVTGFTQAGLLVTNGVASNFVAVNATTYTFNVTPTTQGAVTVTVAANAATNAGNQGNLASLTKSVTFDTVAPAITINPLVTNIVTPTISGTVDDPTATVNVTVNGQTVTATVTNNNWSATLTTALATGVYSVSAVATDPAGNTSTATNATGLTIDVTAPTVAITSTTASPTSGPFPISVVFSENVTGFVVGDITVTNGTLSNFVAVNGTTYTATVTPTVVGNVGVNVAAGVASDAAGNQNTAGTFLIIFNNTTAPTVAVTTTAGAATNVSPIPFTATFSQDVTGFVVGDLQVANGTASNFVAVNASTYTFNVTPTAQGTVTVTVPAGVATNAGNQGNITSGATNITFDTTAPVVTVNPLLTNNTTPTLTGFVSEPTAAVHVTVNGQTVLATVVNTTWSATFTTALPANTFSVTAVATDAAGNSATATNPGGLTIDLTPPAVTINSTTTGPTTGPFPVTFSFSKTVTGFVPADITVTGGTLSNFATIDGSHYTANVTPTIAGTVTVHVAANSATDAAGNGNTVGDFSIVFNDTGAPLATVTTTAGAATNVSPIPFTASFTQDVTGFSQADLTVANGTVSNFVAVDARTYTFNVTPSGQLTVSVSIPANAATNSTSVGNLASLITNVVFDTKAPIVTINPVVTNSTTPTITGTIDDPTAALKVTVNGQVVNATITGTTWTATVTIPLAAGTYAVVATARDAANNNGSATNASGLIIDLTAPAASISSTTTSPATGAFPISVVFTEPVNNFVAADINVTNGTLSNFVAVAGGTTFTATITPLATGTVTVNVPANIAQDAAGNGNTASQVFSIAFNGSAGAPTVAHAISNITNSASAASTTMLLAGTFDDDGINNSSVTFNILKGTTPETVNLNLFDKDAPLTVANFFDYLDRYAQNGGTLFHRTNLQTGLNVIQGGGYTFNSATNTINPHITTDAPIRNEYSNTHPNNRGTISMAKLGGDPNSATSEFFFNLDNANATTLGSSNNGGFTVFGQTQSAADLAVLDDLATVPIVNTGGFSQLPLISGSTPTSDNILRIQSVTVNNRDNDLTYTVTSSNPAVVTAAVAGFQGNQLTLDYQTAGSSTITVNVTDRDGHTASTTFVVTVTN